MPTFLRDVRHALRTLTRRPGFSLVVILTLATGIGANAAIFTFLREVVFPTLRAPDQHRLSWFVAYTPESSWGATSYPDLVDYRAAMKDDGDFYMWRTFGATLVLEDEGEGTVFAWGEAVEPRHFEVFGGRVELGRGFLPADNRSGAERVTVLHHLFWQRHYGGDPGVLGRRLDLNGHTYTVVGVTSRGFQGHGMTHELYTPLSHIGDVYPGVREDRQRRMLSGVFKLKPGKSREQAAAKLAAVAARLDETAPLEVGARRVELRPIREGSDYYKTEVTLLMTTVGLLLLLAAANVANLLLTRAAERRREIAVHCAIGAGRGRLARRLLTESGLLALAGGLCGLGFADPLSRVMESYLVGGPVGTGAWGEGSRIFVLDQEVVLFTMALSVVVGFVFGAAPLVYAWRLDLVTALKSGAGDAGSGRRLGGRQALVLVQVVLSVVLLLGAGLLVRSLLAAHSRHPGFDTDRLLLATLYLAPAPDGEDGAGRGRGVYDIALERLSALPAVESATLANHVPLGGFHDTAKMADTSRPDEERSFGYLEVGPGFFATLGVSLERGRGLERRDRAAQFGAAVVNRRLADELWPGEDPLGRTLEVPVAKPSRLRVVGVVSDFRNKSVIEDPQPQLYTLPRRYSRLTVIVRTTGGPLTEAAAEVRRTVAGLDRDVSLVDLAPFQAQIDYSFQDRRLVTDTALLFGLLGLALAATGIFSVMSYTVSARSREIGIRMAVGATAREVGRMVLRQTLALVAAGTLVGVIAALAFTRFLRSLLYGVGSSDPVTFVLVPLLLGLTALVAALVPATRAARVDPKAVLRQD